MNLILFRSRKRFVQLATAFMLSLSLLMAGELRALAQNPAEKPDPAPARDDVAATGKAEAKTDAKSPTQDQGQVNGNYTMKSSIEVGYRWVGVGGNADRYRSDLNVRDGLRLFDFSFDARSLDGNGALFDFLRADISNAGGDHA